MIWLLDTGIVITFLFHLEPASLVILIKTDVVAATGARTRSALVSSRNERPKPRTTRLTTVTRILLFAIYKSFNKTPFIVFPPLHREA
jgi:hypothetical protein